MLHLSGERGTVFSLDDILVAEFLLYYQFFGQVISSVVLMQIKRESVTLVGVITRLVRREEGRMHLLVSSTFVLSILNAAIALKDLKTILN